jgi:transposase
LLSRFPEQRTYELLRPVVLFGLSSAERARQTGAPERTLYRQVARFEAQGMASLFTPAPTPQHHLPDEISQAIRHLKAEYPPLRPHEIATICATRFGRRPSPHTVKRILAEEPVPDRVPRRYPPYHEIAEAAERRLAIIRLHSAGWTITSTAGYLAIDRRTVSRTLRRWIDEGGARTGR